jgi:hypothetical protein
MRRGLSIALILFFGLGPLAAALKASDDARLPACCRRHGEHHCAMNEQAAARMALLAHASNPAFTAPLHCPAFPSSGAATTAQVHALAPSAAGLQVLLAHPRSAASSRAAARLRPIRTRSGRAPPSNLLS